MNRPGRLRRLLRRCSHFAHVRDPTELRIDSPQYGELILDGEPIVRSIEYESLTWSDDRRLLAAQQFVSGLDGPRTRIVVIDSERRVELVVTPAIDGLCNPLRFEDDVLEGLYRALAVDAGPAGVRARRRVRM